jgi:hypothetical protein
MNAQLASKSKPITVVVDPTVVVPVVRWEAHRALVLRLMMLGPKTFRNQLRKQLR